MGDTIKIPHFEPWVGRNYKEQECKIFILGESFINNGKSETMENREKKTNRVIEIIEEVQSGETKAKNKRHNNVFRSYNNMFRMLYNEKKVKPLLKNWNNYSFANFFQKYVADKKIEGVHTKHIKKPDIEIARKSLKKYLEILSPDLTIVWGKSKMKNKWLPTPSKKTKIQELNIENFYKYTFDEKTYYIWFIHHPSYFKNREKQHNDYKKLEKYIVENKITNK